jgi:DNA-binding NarL/FixJ family response regulator
VRILIANHRPIARDGLRALLTREPDLEIVGETDDGSEAVQLAQRLRPHVVLIDASIPVLDGIAATRKIRAEPGATQVIVMTGANGEASAIQAIRAGAVAFLHHGSRTEDLLRSIRNARVGEVTLPAQEAAHLIRLVGRHETLSRRESEVLRLVARGLANKQIAHELALSRATVKCHVSSILAKLGLASRTQVALYAARIGLVPLEHLSNATSPPRVEAVPGG